MTPFERALVDERQGLRRQCMHITRNIDQAEDLCQSVMVKALSNSHLFKPGTNLRAWLNIIARNEWYSIYRKSSKTVQPFEDDPKEPLAVDDQHISAEARDCARAFASLPKIYRDCMHLQLVLGHTVDEVVNILGLPSGTVKSRVHRGRELLAKKLESTNVLRNPPIFAGVGTCSTVPGSIEGLGIGFGATTDYSGLESPTTFGRELYPQAEEDNPKPG